MNRAVKYNLIQGTTKESGLSGDMNFKQVLTKSPQEIEAEYNLLNIYLKSNPSTDVAMMPQNKLKNRYINTMPCKIKSKLLFVVYYILLSCLVDDYNRVIIKSKDNDYINASFIEVSLKIF